MWPSVHATPIHMYMMLYFEFPLLSMYCENDCSPPSVLMSTNYSYFKACSRVQEKHVISFNLFYIDICLLLCIALNVPQNC